MTEAQTVLTASDRLEDLVGRLEAQRGFAEVIASLQAGHAATLGGVWGSSCALVAASLVRHAPGPAGRRLAAHRRPRRLLRRPGAVLRGQARAVSGLGARSSESTVVYDEIYGERLRLLKIARRAPQPPRLIVTSIQSLLQPVPSREKLASQTRRIRRGDVGRRRGAADAGWSSNGFQNTSAVELPGEFSPRGGILDIFAPDWYDPVRIELFGDEIESIRRFEVATQRSLAALDEIDVTMLDPRRGRSRALRRLSAGRTPGSSWSSRRTWRKKAGTTWNGSSGRRISTASPARMRQVTRFPSVTAASVPSRLAGNDLPPGDRIGRAVQRRHRQGARRARRRRWAPARPAGKTCSSSARPRPKRSGCKRSSRRRGWPPPAGCTFRSAG